MLTPCKNPDPEDENRIRRTQRVLSKEEELGRYHQLGIHQGFIEQRFISLLKKEGCVQVERCIETKSLELDQAIATDPHAYPVALRLRRGDAANKGSSPDAFGKSSCTPALIIG